MLTSPHAAALASGLATGIGSLPHLDAREAAELTLRLHPTLPAAPELPERDRREGLVAQWAGALPEVTVASDGTLSIDRARIAEPIAPVFAPATHAGLLAFLDAFDAVYVPS